MLTYVVARTCGCEHMGILYIVATPIGNLEDVSIRALRILREVSLIAAEDTRTTRKLLQRYDIHTPLISYFEGNRGQRIPFLVEKLASGDIALVSEAGVPGIHDPGLELVNASLEQGYDVVPISGPSAVTTALSVAGLPSDEFIFLGFLPRKKRQRQQLLQDVFLESRTLVIFETRHRLLDALGDMIQAFGANRYVTVCRELTKLHEEIYRGTLSDAKTHFLQPRGEFTLVIEGTKDLEEMHKSQIEDITEDLLQLKRSGSPLREAVLWMAKHHSLNRRQTYKMWLELDTQ